MVGCHVRQVRLADLEALLLEKLAGAEGDILEDRTWNWEPLMMLLPDEPRLLLNSLELHSGMTLSPVLERFCQRFVAVGQHSCRWT